MPEDYELRLKPSECKHRNIEVKKWCAEEYWDQLKQKWVNYSVIHMDVCLDCGAARWDYNWYLPVE
jgi:hypothetical protein